MRSDSPWLLLLLLGASLYAARMWWSDLQAAKQGRPAIKPLPGAQPAPFSAVLLAVAGAGAILALETWGEYRLGISGEQSKITVLFGLYTLAAAFVEELIFRGFLTIENRGRGWLVIGILGASIGFALLHPFLWKWENGRLLFTFGPKGWFSTAIVFAASLWFYTVRFWSLNPLRSLWPCIAAHAAKNLGVLAIKHAQGFVDGWW